MRKLLLILLIAVSVLGLAACSSDSNDSPLSGSAQRADVGGGGSSNMMAAPGDSYYEAEGAWNGDYGNTATSLYEIDEIDTVTSGTNEPLTPPASAETSPAETRRVVIRNGFMELETKRPSELFRVLDTYADFLGGYVFSSEVNNFDDYSRVNAIFKLPPEKLDDFMNYAGDNGTILVSRVDSNDVTNEFYDLMTRLETKRRSLEAYYTLLQNADDIATIVSMQRTIDGIIEEIESVEGKLRVFRSLSEMATVNVVIRQEIEQVEEEEERREVDWSSLSLDDMGYFIRTGFISVVNVIWTIVVWVINVVAVTSPVWVPAGVVLVVVLRRRRKKK